VSSAPPPAHEGERPERFDFLIRNGSLLDAIDPDGDTTLTTYGAYIAKGAIFLAAAALCIPALIALNFIRSDEIDYARARSAKSTKQSGAKGAASKQAGGKRVVTATSILALAKNRKLVLFTAAIVLFQLADTSMLPMMGANLATTRGDHAAIWMSGLIVVPQVVVAIFGALGRISFGEKRPAAASSDRLCARALRCTSSRHRSRHRATD
jgi:hypothetical protein